jgi:outer membrane lipoprotein-sorting protein
MRSRLVIFVIVAVLAAALVAVVVAVAGADQSSSLPAVSAQDLLANMAQHGNQTVGVSGEISWHNGLLGNTASLGNDNVGALPAESPLVGDGSGRIWLGSGGARIESQGSSGDQTVVVDAARHTVWVYDFSTNSAKKIVTSGGPASSVATPTPSASMMTPGAVSALLQRVAPYATLEVTGQATVAGRDAYILRLTPVATNSALGYLQAAVDGRTLVPLRLEVFAKGGTTPVLQFGFVRVSYGPVASSRFEFTPPPGTKVTVKTADLTKIKAQGGVESAGAAPTKARKAQRLKLVRSVLLSVPQAQKLVRFKIGSAHDAARPFQWAAVVAKGGPLNAVGKPLMGLLGATGTVGTSGAPVGAGSAGGPTAVLLYGKGFGTIVLAQTKTTPALEKQLKQLPAIVDTTAQNGVTARTLTTPLGGVYIWQHGNTTMVAGGLVTAADLEAFAGSVR